MQYLAPEAQAVDLPPALRQERAANLISTTVSAIHQWLDLNRHRRAFGLKFLLTNNQAYQCH